MSTLSLDEIIRLLGGNPVRWRWRWMRFTQRIDQFLARFTHARQTVAYRHKFCPECGALLDREEKKCPHCGARAGSAKLQALGRGLNMLAPGEGAVTALLLSVNCAYFLWGGYRYGARHLIAPEGQALVLQGALLPPHGLGQAWWGLITYGYVHGGLFHLFFNMLVLYRTGPFLERIIGPARFFSVYTLSLLGGSLADVVFRAKEMVPVVGASGALFGLIGFGIAFGHLQGGPSGRNLRDFFLRWAVYAFLFGFLVPGIDNIAHAGGLVAGLASGSLISFEERPGRSFPLAWQFVALLCVAFTGVCFVALNVML